MRLSNRSVATTRRTFLLSGLLAGGSLVVGVGVFNSAWMVESHATEIANWVIIAPNNTVTLRIAQMEMGQGATTTMAQLLAEELEVDWSRIRTEYYAPTVDLLRGHVYGRTVTAASEGVVK